MINNTVDMIWNEFTEIDIIYSIYNTIEIDGTCYHKAYIVQHGNQKSLESACEWAKKPYFDKSDSSPLILEAISNSGFTMRIAKAADTSEAVSGKLAFWMCIFEKDGIEPFATGINSELLCLLITQSTIVNGRVSEDVFFARCNGQLGVLHKHMAAYQDYLLVLQKKQSMSKNKTTKWQLGKIYSTVRCSDVMMGSLVMPLRNITDYNAIPRFGSNRFANRYTLDFSSKPMKIFSSANQADLYNPYVLGICFTNGSGPDELDDFETCLSQGLMSPKDKCPSRHCAGLAPFATDNHEQKIITSLEKICKLIYTRLHQQDSKRDNSVNYRNVWVELTGLYLVLCDINPKRGLDLLGMLDQEVQEHITDSRIESFPFPYELIYDGNLEQFGSQFDLVARIVELARNHYRCII